MLNIDMYFNLGHFCGNKVPNIFSGIKSLCTFVLSYIFCWLLYCVVFSPVSDLDALLVKSPLTKIFWVFLVLSQIQKRNFHCVYIDILKYLCPDVFLSILVSVGLKVAMTDKSASSLIKLILTLVMH
jgi:hypothetical protein